MVENAAAVERFVILGGHVIERDAALVEDAGGDHHRDLFGAELDFTLAFQRFHVDDRIADLGVSRDVIGRSVKRACRLVALGRLGFTLYRDDIGDRLGSVAGFGVADICRRRIAARQVFVYIVFAAVLIELRDLLYILSCRMMPSLTS